VVVTGAFLTGEPLKVRVADYARVQRALGEGLKSRTAEGWDYEPLKWQDIAGSYDIRQGYPSLVPLVLLRRGGDDLRRLAEATLRGRPPAEHECFVAAAAGCSWTLRSIAIELFDFGVGVIEGLYDVRAPIGLDAARTRRAVERVSRLKPDGPGGVRSPIAASYDDMALDTVRAFREAVGTHTADATHEPWLTPLQQALAEHSSDGRVTAAPTSEWGRLLWLHPVYVLRARWSAGQTELRRVGRPFRSNFVKTVEMADVHFSPGIDSSLMVVRGDPASRRNDLMRLVVLHSAYYALFMEIDRGLLATLDNDKWETPDALSALEEDGERMFEVYMRVQETKARLNSVLGDFGGGALTLWEAIADSQRLGHLVVSVDGKVDALQHIAERRVQEAAAARARRTGNVLGGLAALTVVTVVIGLFGSLVGSRADNFGHIALRSVTIAAAFLVALLLYLRQREIVRRRKGGRARDERRGHRGELARP
jgi:hypothetical protein